jgi:CBS domain-containing protein
METWASYGFTATNGARGECGAIAVVMIESIVAIFPGGETVLVRDGMTGMVLTVGPGHTLREAARAMCARRVGAAVVVDPELPGPGVITERDILTAIGSGQDPDQEHVSEHLTSQLTFAAPDWSLERAAETMVRGGFRHLVVVDRGDMAGILSMRDIVRVWTGDGASCELPAGAAAS